MYNYALKVLYTVTLYLCNMYSVQCSTLYSTLYIKRQYTYLFLFWQKIYIWEIVDKYWLLKIYSYPGTFDPLVKVNSTSSLTASTLLQRVVLLSVRFIARAIQYKLRLERLTRLGNSNVLRLTLRVKMAMPNSQRFPFSHFLINNVKDIVVFQGFW